MKTPSISITLIFNEVALEGLGGINEVEVVRTGDATQGYSYTIAFMDSPSANVAQMTVEGGPSHGHESCRGLWYGGENFTVGVTTTSEGGITGVFQHDVSASVMQTELNKIPHTNNFRWPLKVN